MARVSRKNKPQETVRKTKEWNTAIYARLSQNNGDQSKESIEVQIAIAREYISEHPELVLTDVYADNGYTGRNFDRPEFIRLIEDVRNKKINCIVLKDLSRFGRNFVETGYYFETLFPFLGVRYISINDHYDSMTGNTKGGITLPIKDMLNELYSRDLSNKIRYSFTKKKERGEITFRAPYGYQKNPEDKRRIVIDEETAPFVQKIFAWYEDGDSMSKIAEKLTLLDAVRPFERLRQLGNWKGRTLKGDKWTSSEVANILWNPIYTGNMVYGRYNYVGTKSKNHKDISETHITQNTHEAIISEEQFLRVNADFRERRERYAEGQKRAAEVRGDLKPVLGPMFYCSCCGRKMSTQYQVFHGKAKFIAYRCTKKGCVKRPQIEERYLQILAMDQIRDQLQLRIDINEFRKKYVTSTGYYERKKAFEDAVSSAEAKVNQYKRHKREQYEACVAGDLSNEEFKVLSQKMNDQIMESEAKAEECRTELKVFLELHSEDAFLKKWNCFSVKDVRFSKELVEDMISRIEYDETGAIHITFKTDDLFEERIRLMEGNK